MRYPYAFNVLAALLLVNVSLYAQPPAILDPSFNPDDAGWAMDPGFNGWIAASALQTDGKILLGGSFTAVDGVPRRYITRVHANGQLDATFVPDSALANAIYAVTPLSDGKILVCGSGYYPDNSYNARLTFARLHADGRCDTTFQMGTGFEGPIVTPSRMIRILPNGKFFVNGAFNSYNGQERPNLVRLQADGTLDSSFDAQMSPYVLGFSPYQEVMAVEHLPNGQLLVGGQFTQIGGGLRQHLARLHTDGSLDTTFLPDGSGFNARVRTILRLPDDRLLVGGEFSSYRGTARNGIALLLPDGNLDTTWQPHGWSTVRALHSYPQPDGSFLLTGNFRQSLQHKQVALVRLMPDGLLQDAAPLHFGSQDSDVTTISLQFLPENRMLVTGNFYVDEDQLYHHIFVFEQDGTLSPQFSLGSNTGSNGSVIQLEALPDDRLLVNGNATLYNGARVHRFMRLHPDGTLDTLFRAGQWLEGVEKFTVLADGRVLCGGRELFTRSGVRLPNLVRLHANGSLDTTFTAALLNIDTQLEIVETPQGYLIGGYFDTQGDNARKSLVRLLPDGSLDLSFDASGVFPHTVGYFAAARITRLVARADGKIYVRFNQFNQNPWQISRGLLRLNNDGSFDEGFAPIPLSSPFNQVLLHQPDGKIIADDHQAIGSDSLYVKRWLPDGSEDSLFTPTIIPNTFIRTALLQPDGKILMGGSGIDAPPNIIRLLPNGGLDVDFLQTPGFNFGISTMAFQSDYKLVVGGVFTAYGQTGRNRIARLDTDVTVGLSSFENSFRIVAYPNPARTQLRVTGWPVGEEITLTLHDALGRMVLQRQATTTAQIASSSLSLPVDHLRPGTYRITVFTSYQMSTCSVIIVR